MATVAGRSGKSCRRHEQGADSDESAETPTRVRKEELAEGHYSAIGDHRARDESERRPSTDVRVPPPGVGRRYPVALGRRPPGRGNRRGFSGRATVADSAVGRARTQKRPGGHASDARAGLDVAGDDSASRYDDVSSDPGHEGRLRPQPGVLADAKGETLKCSELNDPGDGS